MVLVVRSPGLGSWIPHKFYGSKYIQFVGHSRLYRFAKGWRSPLATFRTCATGGFLIEGLKALLQARLADSKSLANRTVLVINVSIQFFENRWNCVSLKFEPLF